MPKIKLLWYTPNPEFQITRAASVCYNSQETDTGRIARLRKSGHFATFRFASAAFQVSDISRVCSHQLVRHKHLDYLQRSQRYCNENLLSVCIPESMDSSEARSLMLSTIMAAQETYTKLRELGVPKEDARFCLPQAVTTIVNVVGNFQAWRDFVKLRNTPKAQWEIRAVAKEICKRLYKIAPNCFEDLYEAEK